MVLSENIYISCTLPSPNLQTLSIYTPPNFSESRWSLVTLVEQLDFTICGCLAHNFAPLFSIWLQWLQAGSQVVVIGQGVSIPHVDSHQVSAGTAKVQLLIPNWVSIWRNDPGFLGVATNGHLSETKMTMLTGKYLENTQEKTFKSDSLQALCNNGTSSGDVIRR